MPKQNPHVAAFLTYLQGNVQWMDPSLVKDRLAFETIGKIILPVLPTSGRPSSSFQPHQAFNINLSIAEAIAPGFAWLIGLEDF
jgi:hypothetical protein